MTRLKHLKAFAFVAMLLLISAHALAQPAVRLSSVSGHPGDEVELSISTQGLSAVTALQLSITLPQALDYVDGSAVLNASMATANHQLQATQTGRQLKIYVYSLQLATLKDAPGQLFSFRLLMGHTPGSYTLKPSVVFSNTGGADIPATAAAGTVTVLSPNIRLSSQTIDFGRVPLYGRYSKTLLASNNGNEPLTLTSAACSSDELSVSGLPVTLQPGGQQELLVSYVPTKARQEDASVKLFSNAANGSQTVLVKAQPYSENELSVKTTKSPSTNPEQITVSVAMNNMEPIAAVQCAFRLPSALHYQEGSLTMNTSRSDGHQMSSSLVDGMLQVFIHSTSNKTISAGDGELFSFRLQSVGASGNYQLSPSDVILSSADGVNMLSGITDAEVHLSAPRLEVESQIDYGRVPLANAVDRSFSIRNTGETQLTVSRIEIDNPSFTVSPVLPINIEAGASKDVKLTYHPENAGPFQGVMQIYSNDPDQRMMVVNIQGATYHPNQLVLNGSEMANGQYALTIGLQNTLPIVALQADLHWIPGMTASATDVSLASRVGDHQVVLNRLSDDTYRLFLYSASNQVIPAGEGALLTLLYQKALPTADPVGSVITVDNIILSTPEGKNQSSSAVTMMTVSKHGDVNADGLITVADVTAVVNYLLERHTSAVTLGNADVNGDGRVTIIDVVETIQLVLSGEE